MGARKMLKLEKVFIVPSLGIYLHRRIERYTSRYTITVSSSDSQITLLFQRFFFLFSFLYFFIVSSNLAIQHEPEIQINVGLQMYNKEI